MSISLSVQYQTQKRQDLNVSVLQHDAPLSLSQSNAAMTQIANSEIEEHFSMTFVSVVRGFAELAFVIQSKTSFNLFNKKHSGLLFLSVFKTELLLSPNFQAFSSAMV